MMNTIEDEIKSIKLNPVLLKKMKSEIYIAERKNLNTNEKNKAQMGELLMKIIEGILKEGEN